MLLSKDLIDKELGLSVEKLKKKALTISAS